MTSERKAAAAKANGSKGGRPRREPLIVSITGVRLAGGSPISETARKDTEQMLAARVDMALREAVRPSNPIEEMSAIMPFGHKVGQMISLTYNGQQSEMIIWRVSPIDDRKERVDARRKAVTLLTCSMCGHKAHTPGLCEFGLADGECPCDVNHSHRTLQSAVRKQ